MGGGGPYYVSLGGSRILASDRTDLSGADDADVVDHDKANDIIVAVNINSGGKDTEAAQYKIRWRDETDSPGGAFGDLDTTGECKFGSTDLVNGAGIAEGGRKCDSQGGDTWQSGEEVEGTKLSDSIDLPDEYETEIHVSVSLADSDSAHKYTFELYDDTAGASRGTLGAQITIASGVDDCVADNITAGTPILGTPVIEQVHALIATALLSGSPVLATPEVGQEHALLANGIVAGAPILGTPVLEEVTVDECVADNITAGSPVLDTPDIAQIHALTASNLETQNPILEAATLGQEHALAADNLAAGAPVLASPDIAVIENLEANDIVTGAPVLVTPDIGQEHALLADNIAAGAPVLETPVLTEVDILAADDILAGSPDLGSPTAGQAHDLVALGITAGGGADSGLFLSLDGKLYHKSGSILMSLE